MSIKKFSIYASIILSFMVIACIICCFIIIPTPIELKNEPTSITVYNYEISSTGVTATKTNTKANDFDKLYNEFINTTNFSVFERILTGANIYKKPSQDVNQTKPTWSSAKSKAATIELSFKEKESIVVYVDGYSKKIDFYGLAMVVSSSLQVHEVSLYFKTTAGGTYTSTPILIQMKTNKLYKQISTIDFK